VNSAPCAKTSVTKADTKRTVASQEINSTREGETGKRNFQLPSRSIGTIHQIISKVKNLKMIIGNSFVV
jgi:uncharacterized protein YifN (PemK superfamily)